MSAIHSGANLRCRLAVPAAVRARVYTCPVTRNPRGFTPGVVNPPLTSMTHATIQEINEQPAAIEAMLAELSEREPELRSTLSPSTTFCVTGCGTSYYLSHTGSTLLDQVASSVAIPGSEALVSPGQLPDDVDVIVPVSRSGTSTETVRAADALAERYPDATVMGLTCTEGSPIHERSDLPLLSPQGAEESVVMTKSYSSMLAGFEYVARTIATDGDVGDEFQSLPDDSETVLEQAEEVGEELGERTDLEKSFFLGTGELFGLASEAMLKFEEMTLSWTKAYHTLEFRHGPQSIAGEDTLVTAFVPDRRLDLQADLLADAADLGATTLAVGTRSVLDELDTAYEVAIPEREVGSLPLYAPAFQYLGYYRAVARDLDPDDPQNLTQVVTF